MNALNKHVLRLKHLFTGNMYEFISSCHKLRYKIFKQYDLLRCKISCKKEKYKNKRKYFDSKIITMHSLIASYKISPVFNSGRILYRIDKKK